MLRFQFLSKSGFELLRVKPGAPEKLGDTPTVVRTHLKKKETVGFLAAECSKGTTVDNPVHARSLLVSSCVMIHRTTYCSEESVMRRP